MVRHLRCGVILSFLGHHLNIYHPISDVIPLSGKWSCRYLPESQRKSLNQGKKQVNLGQEGDILSFTRALRLAKKVYPEHTIDTFEDFFGRALQRHRVKHAEGNGIYPPSGSGRLGWSGCYCMGKQEGNCRPDQCCTLEWKPRIIKQ